jgi:hypothetical protein
MTLVEFDISSGKRCAIVAEHIHGITERDGNTTLIIMARMNDETDDDFIVEEPYSKVKEKLAKTVL